MDWLKHHLMPTPRTGHVHWTLAAGLVAAALIVIAFIGWQLGSIYLR
jgi:hypothetical protein